MYVLIELKPRAHTTDTLVLGVSNSANIFQEVILSFWEEVYYTNYCLYMNNSYSHKNAMAMARFDADTYSSRFYIIQTPFWEDRA